MEVVWNNITHTHTHKTKSSYELNERNEGERIGNVEMSRYRNKMRGGKGTFIEKIQKVLFKICYRAEKKGSITTKDSPELSQKLKTILSS